jgi:hypothetical protein
MTTSLMLIFSVAQRRLPRMTRARQSMAGMLPLFGLNSCPEESADAR